MKPQPHWIITYGQLGELPEYQQIRIEPDGNCWTPRSAAGLALAYQRRRSWWTEETLRKEAENERKWLAREASFESRSFEGARCSWIRVIRVVLGEGPRYEIVGTAGSAG